MGVNDIAAVALILGGIVFGVTRGALRITVPLAVLAAGIVVLDHYEWRVVELTGDTAWAPWATAGALLVAMMLAGGLVEALTGGRPPGALDRAVGVAVGVGLGLAAVWVAAVLVNASGPEGRRAVGRSEVAARVLAAVPPETVLERLSRFDDIPVLSNFVPTRQPPRDAGVVASDAVLERVHASVVRIDTEACGGHWLGTGWVAEPGVVVTNAHVVAGEDRPVVTDADGRAHDGTVLYADAHADVAVVRVDGLGAPALTVAGDPPFGAQLTFTGFPGGGPRTDRPARSAGVQALWFQVDGGARTWQRYLVLRGQVRHGNSGGPVTDTAGRVVGMISASDEDRLGFAVPVAAIRTALAAPRTGASVSCGAKGG